MMKENFFSCAAKLNTLFIRTKLLLVFAGLLAFSACATVKKPVPKPLDLRTITEDLPVYSISFLVRTDMDENGQGSDFIESFFLRHTDLIKQNLAEEGINMASRQFLYDFANDPKIELEVLTIGSQSVLNRYYWKTANKPETRLELILRFVILKDGSMPLEVTARKDDPEYEPGYAKTVMLYFFFKQ